MTDALWDCQDKLSCSLQSAILFFEERSVKFFSDEKNFPIDAKIN